ncbi:YbaB/EbfC family nucleoid-associated protein [Nocardia sputi]|uniref:YbaB/EbfC family nucleoid-associated protein n=1 Tax=Nocardia sputi TaxID=2943705 RepID=UPI0018944682|nr:YbaB/EbfC family nucleoid-associated protein [Nocardia sputi]MBF6202682.1 YbaB/EbfC family nucleoid-associated protein [Streptomyces gardneri]
MGDIDPVSGHIERLQRALTDARGKAASADGSLRVEVGANGTLHSIELGEGGAYLDPRRLVEMIIDLHRAAVADAAAVMRETVAALSSDPRLQEGRQHVVDKLTQPRPSNEPIHTGVSSPTADQQHVSARAREGSPSEPNTAPSVTQTPTPSRAAPRAPIRTAPTRAATPATRPAKSPRHHPAPARISEFDPVTYAPVTRTRRQSTPDRPTDTSPQPRTATEPPAAENTGGGTSQPLHSTEGSTPSLPRAAASSPVDITESVIAWHDPSDDSHITGASWPPDDYPLMSDEWWWGPHSTDGI